MGWGRGDGGGRRKWGIIGKGNVPLGQTPDSQAPSNWRASLKATGRPDALCTAGPGVLQLRVPRNDSPQKSEASAPSFCGWWLRFRRSRGRLPLSTRKGLLKGVKFTAERCNLVG